MRHIICAVPVLVTWNITWQLKIIDFLFLKKKKNHCFSKKKKKKSFSYKKDNSLIENSWLEIKIMKILAVLDMVGPKSNIVQVRCCNKVSFIFRHSKSYWKNVLIVTNILYQTTDRRGNNIIFSTYIKSKKQKKKKNQVQTYKIFLRKRNYLSLFRCRWHLIPKAYRWSKVQIMNQPLNYV